MPEIKNGERYLKSPQKRLPLQTHIMRDMKKSVCILVLLLTSLLFAPATVRANEVVDADSMQISLLTCGPGSEVYELYGHTALRVRHEKTGADWVFNYGIFDFNAPHFTWRFMLGKADYMMGAVSYTHLTLPTKLEV